MALSMDKMALNLISVQRDEAPAKAKLLEKALREVTEGNIEKILQYYDNPHTQPDHHRAQGTPSGLREHRRQPQGNSYSDGPTSAGARAWR